MIDSKPLNENEIFGEITSVIKSIDGGCISEEAFYDRFGNLIGYWAYGYYDPNLPYRG